MDVSSITSMLPAEGGVPEWIHLLPAGTFSDTAGTKYRLGDAGPVIAASMTAGKLPLDENHSTQRAPEAGNASPARGWIVALENRADGMWARVEWNSSGIALMTDKAYRYISPVFKYDINGNVTRILSAALTNNPGLPQLTALQTSGDKMDKVAICTALGLAETVDDGVVLTALQTAAQSGTALQTAQARIAELERSTVPVTEMVAMQTRLQTLEAKGKTDAATAFVDTAIKAGKPIAATRDQFIAMHTADPGGTEKIINGLPSIHIREAPGGQRTAMQDAGDGDLSAEDMAVCTAMGLDKEMYKKKFGKSKGAEGSAV